MEKKIQLPVSEKMIRSLKIGDQVLLSGIIFTARDLAHKRLFKRGDEFPEMKNGCIYHCGPIVIEKNGKNIVTAAGPTTSIRQEAYTPEIIKNYGVRLIIGKGGMAEETAEALKNYGGVYLQAVGGAAQILAEKIVKIKNVYFRDLGDPEAIWELEVKEFPAVVAMDSSGGSLYKEIEKSSYNKLKEIV